MNVEQLADDPAFLKQLILELDETNQTLSRDNVKLNHQLEQLRKRLYGRSSEKVALPQELFIYAGLPTTSEPEPETETVSDAPAEDTPAKPKKKGHGRKPLPADLPRTVIEHKLPESACRCGACGGDLEQIAWEASEQLEYIPASLRVIQHLRAKYACPRCADTVVTAHKPAQPIEKGLAGPGLLAYVLVSKYADHLPLYRLSRMLWRHKVAVSESTMMDWVAQCAALLRIVVDAMHADLLLSRIIGTDDTPVPVQDRSRKQTKEGRLWVYLGDDDHPQIVYDYTPDRSRAGPLHVLGEWRGTLQADAYPGYDELHRQGVVEAGCWAHARRKFVDAQTTGGETALLALAHIRGLYEIERELKAEAKACDLDRAAFYALRAQRRADQAKPKLAAIAEWLDQEAARNLPKSPLGEAVGYARNQWAALCRYAEDGALEIDNNASERALRRVAVGRKNWLFAGSDAGGERAAIIYSLIATCQRHGVEPWAYLYDVLKRLPTHSIQRLPELFPQHWSPQQD